MSRDFFEIEKGLSIAEENSDNSVKLITGSAAPDGLGDQASAEIGSLYIRRGTGELYQKVSNAGNAADWKISGGSTIGTWRPEKVRAHTGDTGVVAGSPRNLSTTPFSDDEGTTLAAADFNVGEFIIADNVLLEVTAVAAPNVTFSTPSEAAPLAEGDTFLAINNLTDSPDIQEGQAIITYNGAIMVKVADIDFAFADAIGLRAPYTAGSGDITSVDTVQSAIQKLDGNNDAQDSVLGTAQGDTDLGTFSGSTISDNVSVKTALQEVELAHEEVDQNVDDLITLSGMPENSTDLGTFTGSVISDNATVKQALQELESKDEAQDLIVQEIDQNVDDLITLSGVPENSTNLGAFSGYGSIFLTATETVKSALQKVTDFIGGLRNVEVTGVTTQQMVDEVPVATVGACKWFVYAFEEADPTNVRAWEVWALNDGTSSKESIGPKLRLGSFNFQMDTDVSGGNMRLLASSSTAGVTVRVRRVEVIAP
jgi:hypothetical protein